MMNSVRYFLMCEELVRLPVVVASLHMQPRQMAATVTVTRGGELPG